jgi:RNA polymerase sigma-70 factor (ECF subfamily)
MDKQFRQWTQANQDQVWSLARYLLGDRREAEDVSQEAFIRLWQHREAMSESRVRPWLLRVTRNLCLDRLRARKPEVPLGDEHVVHSTPPEQPLQARELGQWLRREIARLAEPYRSLVVLRDLQQHSYEEVAGVTGLTLAQVKTYLHRARGQLRQRMTEGEISV